MCAEMEAIRYLDRLGRALAATLGVRTGAIADDDLDAGVCAQPIGEDLGGAVIEQVNGPMRFQIQQQRPVPALLFPQRNIIDAQHSRTTLFTVVGEDVQQVKQRIGADGYADLVRQASATLAASLQR